jgi:predicted DNA-binding transcriptional regulator AlpA
MSVENETDERFLSSAAVCKRYGIHPATLDKWIGAVEVNFPRPHRIAGRKYFAVADLQAFERRTVSKPKDHRPSQFKPGSNRPPQARSQAAGGEVPDTKEGPRCRTRVEVMYMVVQHHGNP